MLNGRVSITEDRLQRLSLALENPEQAQNRGGLVRARFLASVIGQIISMQAGMGSVVRFHTHCMYKCLLTRSSWNASIFLDSKAKDEIRFWKENSKELNGQDLVGSNECTISVYSDASDTGFGGYIDGIEDSEVIGTWSEFEAEQSSTWKELEALSRVYSTLAPALEGQTVQWFTDNKNVTKIMKCGSKNDGLRKIAQEISEKSELDNAELVLKWIPREENLQSDFLSHCFCLNDWQIERPFFDRLERIWGKFTVDRFAADYNTKTKRFNSRWFCPGTEGIDAFSQSWENLRTTGSFHPLDWCQKSFKKCKVKKQKGPLFDELSALKCYDIEFFEKHLAIQIEKSKTDQYRQGSEVVIAKGVNSACPYNMIHRYFTKAGLSVSSPDFIFRPVFKYKKVHKLIYKNKSLSYTHTRECVVSRLKEINSSFGCSMARALKYLFSKIELIAKNTLSTSSKSYYLPSGNRFSKRFYSLDVVSDDVIPKPSERLYIPRRAVLYVPGNDEKKLMKIPSFELDCAVMDLEDGVALTRKEEARIVIRHMLEELKFGQTECVVRVNAVSSGLMEDDMKSVFKAKNLPQTLMLPKVHKAEELDRFTKILMSTVAVREKKQKFRLVVFVESAIGLLNLRSIFRRGIDLALKEKLFDFDGVVFGSDDFCADIGPNINF
ncbi:hypothetical protein ScPMuIL_013060 [Solemya velum]